MNSIDPLKRRVAALIDASFKRQLEQMSADEVLEFARELEERRDAAMDARARAKGKK